jgi:hypothetical protein
MCNVLKLCVKSCNKYLNLIYAYPCVYVQTILVLPNCVFENVWNQMVYVFFLNMIYLKKLDGSIFQTGGFSFPS